MKIKKSELLALIKEEIMDDPSDDNTIPAEMKKEGTAPSIEIDTVDFSVRHPATLDRLELAGFDLSGMRRHNGGFRITLNKEEADKLRDYIARNRVGFFESKKGQNTMKIKKSELLALIKEEIMDEMRGLTMMDDPMDDDAIPAGMEYGGAMDQVGKEIDDMITVEMDDAISMLSNYLVTSQASRDPRKAAAMGMEILHNAGLRFPDQSTLERMIAADDGIMQEGIDAESMQVVADVAQKMAPLIGVMSLPVLIGLIYEKLKEMGAK